jgi:hypothetical protein
MPGKMTAAISVAISFSRICGLNLTAGGTPCPVTSGAYTAIGALLSTKMITAPS